MHNKQTFKPAFSLLELVFVIVILGIVASLGSELIAKIYESYVLQRAQHRSSIKTDLVATQVANRLRYAIPGTVIRRVGKTDINPELLSQAMTRDQDLYDVLQWVAYDGDSFEAISTDSNRKPGWSGFCDVDASTAATDIPTPGSNLSLANTIIGKLSGSTKSITDATLFFPHDSTAYAISAASGELITLASNPSNRIVEQYKLAWTSYALVVEDDNGDGKKDLVLYYNFSPSPASTIGGSKSILLSNITTFKFQGSGRTTRFKVCREEDIGESFNITSCKEKAVF